MTRGPSRIAPRLLPSVVAAGAIVLFVALGNWPLGRADEKRLLAAAFDAGGPALDWQALPPDAPRYQRVRLRGHYDPGRQFLLDNRSHDGVAGVEVLTPFVLDNGSGVIVNRGWLPFGATRGNLPAVHVDGGRRSVVGRLDELPSPGIRLQAPPAAGWPRLVQFPTSADLAAALGRELAPRQVLLDAAEPDGYARDWTIGGTSIERHIGYAVQWFAFAAVTAAIWFIMSRRKPGESS